MIGSHSVFFSLKKQLSMVQGEGLGGGVDPQYHLSNGGPSNSIVFGLDRRKQYRHHSVMKMAQEERIIFALESLWPR